MKRRKLTFIQHPPLESWLRRFFLFPFVFLPFFSCPALGANIVQTFNFTAAPIVLSPGQSPLILDVNYNQAFASYDDIFLEVFFSQPVKEIVNYGLIFDNQLPPPPYSELTDFGYVIQGLSSSAVPTSQFSSNFAFSSIPEVSAEIVDGRFQLFFQNAPLSRTPSLSSKEDLIVSSAVVTVRGASTLDNPNPVPAPLPILGLPAVLFYSGKLKKRIKENGDVSSKTLV